MNNADRIALENQIDSFLTRKSYEHPDIFSKRRQRHI